MKQMFYLLAILFVGETYSLKENVPTFGLYNHLRRSSRSSKSNTNRSGATGTTPQCTSTAAALASAKFSAKASDLAAEKATAKTSTPIVSAPDPLKTSEKPSEITATSASAPTSQAVSKIALETTSAIASKQISAKVSAKPSETVSAYYGELLLAPKWFTRTSFPVQRKKVINDCTDKPIVSAPPSETSSTPPSAPHSATNLEKAAETTSASSSGPNLAPVLELGTETVSTKTSRPISAPASETASAMALTPAQNGLTIISSPSRCEKVTNIRRYDSNKIYIAKVTLRIAFMTTSTVITLLLFKYRVYMFALKKNVAPVRFKLVPVIRKRILHCMCKVHRGTINVRMAKKCTTKSAQ